MKAEILNRCLKLIEEVYDESMYGNNDIYRIKDLIHSVDNNHWRSKQWLVDEFYKLYNHTDGSFYIGGGWYGLLAYLIREKWPLTVDIPSMFTTNQYSFEGKPLPL